MSEQLGNASNWRTEIHDQFLNQPRDAEKRRLYEERGLLYTNNFSMFFRDLPELLPGLPHPYDHTVRPFAPVIQRFLDTHGDLCDEIARVGDTKRTLATKYWEVMKEHGIDSPEAEDLASQLRPLEWEDAELCTRAMDIVAPWLLEAGFDPVDLCR
jgi:hypothetical protein